MQERSPPLEARPENDKYEYDNPIAVQNENEFDDQTVDNVEEESPPFGRWTNWDWARPRKIDTNLRARSLSPQWSPS